MTNDKVWKASKEKRIQYKRKKKTENNSDPSSSCIAAS